MMFPKMVYTIQSTLPGHITPVSRHLQTNKSVTASTTLMDGISRNERAIFSFLV
jgi:hypothetical protein